MIDERQDKVVWRGNDPTAQLPLDYSSNAKLTVVALSGSRVTPVGSVLATNPAPESRQTPLVSVTTQKGTSLGWGSVPGATDYRLLAGPAESPQQTAMLAQPAVEVPTRLGQSGNYQVLSNDIPQPDPNPGDRDKPGPVTYRYGVEVTPPDIDVAALRPDIRVGDPVPAQPSGIVQTNNSYEPYIPDKYVNAPEDPVGLTCEGNPFGPDWWYDGNNRQAAYHTGNYKTAVDYTMHWAAKRTEVFTDVAATNRYEHHDDGSFTYDSTRQADNTIQARTRSNDGAYAWNATSHGVGNPYCNPVADITYGNSQQVYQDGGHVISGSHDKMPNHQFYRQDMVRTDPNNPNSPLQPRLQLVFNHPYTAPICLGPLTCGMWYYQYVR